MLRLLGMVHELHKQGWQRVRAHLSIAPSNMSWRCCIYPASLLDKDNPNPPCVQGPNELQAFYSTAAERKYFGWQDCQKEDARGLAARFVQRFPTLLREGHGRDWPYVGWYSELLGHVEQGRVPTMSWDNDYADQASQGLWFWPDLIQRFDFPPPPQGRGTRF